MTTHIPADISTPCPRCGARIITVTPKQGNGAPKGESTVCDWPPIWVTPDKRCGERIKGLRVDGLPQMGERRAAIHDLFLVVTPHECPPNNEVSA